eukprot:scaffold285758_cov26-Tisochrysis_lutea.AAC.1
MTFPSRTPVEHRHRPPPCPTRTSARSGHHAKWRLMMRSMWPRGLGCSEQCQAREASENKDSRQGDGQIADAADRPGSMAQATRGRAHLMQRVLALAHSAQPMTLQSWASHKTRSGSRTSVHARATALVGINRASLAHAETGVCPPEPETLQVRT